LNTRKDVSQLLRKLRKAGYIIDRSGKHYKVRDADGRVVLGISRTPSDPRAWRRILADVRRTGVFDKAA
jgi:hypothetical protein